MQCRSVQSTFGGCTSSLNHQKAKSFALSSRFSAPWCGAASAKGKKVVILIKLVCLKTSLLLLIQTVRGEVDGRNTPEVQAFPSKQSKA